MQGSAQSLDAHEALQGVSTVHEPSWDWSSARRHCLREARRVLRHPDDAEEAVQEALVRAWRRRSACRTPEAPLPWMLQITRNEAFRLRACRQRRQARECADRDDEGPPTEDRDLEEVIGAVATEQALSTLRADERALVRLRYVQDLSQPDMARLLDLPEGTVKVRLHRIRERLRNTLKEEP